MGAAAAAVIMMKERQIVEAFEQAGATSAALARDPSELALHAGGTGWRRLTDRAVVRESPTQPGLYYVDLDVWNALHRTRRRLVLVLIAVALATLAFLRIGVGGLQQ